MTSRRQFLAGLTRAILVAAALGISPIIPRVYAIAPLVVLAIVQTAIGVASLFTHGGDGMESLLHLQVEMLKHIESELSTIEQGIQEIFNRLDELKELFGELPAQVVIEQNRAAIRGLSQRYAEIRDTYLAQGRVLSPELTAELQENLISPLRSARDVLMGYPQPQFALVPTISTACFVESLAMAMANTSTQRTQQALVRYRRWFVQVSRGTSESSLEGKIRTLRKTQIANVGKARALSAATPTVTRCYTDKQPGTLGSGNDRIRIPLDVYKCLDDENILTVVPSRDANTSQAVNDMLKRRLLQTDEQPFEINIAPKHTGGWTASYVAGQSQPTSAEFCAGTGHTLSCASYESSASDDASKLSNSLTSDGLQLMSLLALKDAADRAITFIDKLDPSVRTLGHA
jgi:hypothetical protein